MQNKEKQIFDETQEKQSKFLKKYLLSAFCGIGAVFVIIAIISFCLGGMIELPIVFLSVGLFMIVLGVVLYFVIPTKYSYDKYKSKVQKYGYMNIYEMSAKIIELEERIEMLEDKNEQ